MVTKYTLAAAFALTATPTVIAVPQAGTPGPQSAMSALEEAPPEAGAPGGVGLALKAAKILAVPLEGQQVYDRAVVLVRDGKIEAVGTAASIEIPEGYEVRDLGERWLMPGMLDLHAHVGGTFDINDAVYLANTGLRAKTAAIPSNPALDIALAAGVTTVLFIPGSATNVGGEGLLMKTGPDTWEGSLVSDPGGMKVAQWGNPERWLFGVGKSFENYTIREILRRGAVYGDAWKAFDEGAGPEPDKDPQFEIFRFLRNGQAPIAVHTQVHQVVLATIKIIKQELGYDVFIDHGTFDGWRAGGVAAENGVNAILGPRNVSMPNRGTLNWVGDNPERAQGVAAGYYERGHRMIGFNTDSPVIPQEELQLQAAMGARFGLPDTSLETVRGLTIVPAVTVGAGDRLGSIEVGKDADILVIDGHPADPRTTVFEAYIDGALLYDSEERRLW